MRALLAYLGAAVLAGLVVWGASALLPACGVGSTIASRWQDWCPVNSNLETERQLAAMKETSDDLTRRILEHERKLAALQCEPRAPVQTTQPKAIDRGDWNNRRIGLLEGCWSLDSRFVTTNRTTGVKSRYNEWTMCFSADGTGREEMRAENGNTCSGTVTGRFNARGELEIEEPADLPCSDGGYIYRLRSTCQLKENGAANCRVTQPQVGSSTTVEFRRASGGN